jgi:hypothetical protein
MMNDFLVCTNAKLKQMTNGADLMVQVGEQSIEKGPLTVIGYEPVSLHGHLGAHLVGVVNVADVYPLTVANLNDEHAKRAGYDNVVDLLVVLADIDPDLKIGDTVTLIQLEK